MKKNQQEIKAERKRRCEVMQLKFIKLKMQKEF